jgi:hypothetical protein
MVDPGRRAIDKIIWIPKPEDRIQMTDGRWQRAEGEKVRMWEGENVRG